MEKVLLIDAVDNVVTAIEQVNAGDALTVQSPGGELSFVAAQGVGMGHKLAIKAIPAGEKVIKYGAAIGKAKQDIKAGEHVHSHNLEGFRGRE